MQSTTGEQLHADMIAQADEIKDALGLDILDRAGALRLVALVLERASRSPWFTRMAQIDLRTAAVLTAELANLEDDTAEDEEQRERAAP
jgi:hypothetical protein